MSENKVLFFRNSYFPNAKRGPSFSDSFFFPHERGVGFHDGNTLFACSLAEDPRNDVHFLHRPPVSLRDLKSWVSATFGDPDPEPVSYEPGTVYKRIYRPVACGNYFRAVPQDLLRSSLVALRILLTKLDDLFDIVEPVPPNMEVYGHGIREILLLACTDVESSWAGVLRANGLGPTALTTKDYVKLLAPMLLNCYGVSLVSYPQLPSFKPFEDWEEVQPTRSLTWYDAYNKTKHNREDNLKFATLRNAIASVAAAAIMLHAQFGFYFGQSAPFLQASPAMIRNMFNIQADFGNYWRECYIPRFTYKAGTDAHSMGSYDWCAVDYQF